MGVANWDWCHREITTNPKDAMPPHAPSSHESILTRLYHGLGNGVYFLFPLALVSGICLLGVSALDKQVAIEQQAELNLFPTDKILEVEITIEDDVWNKIRHQSRNPSTDPQEKVKFKTARVKIGGVEFPEVGLRKKGFGASLSSGRPSLKIKLNHLDKQAQINGLTMLTFNNNQEDTSLMSQTMGYAMHNAADSPAPRCGYARITVNGKNLGVYSHVETFDRPFLRREFGDDRGPLYEGTAVDFFDGREKDFENKLSMDKLGQDKIKQLLDDLGRKKINQLIEILEQDNSHDIVQAIAELVDLDSFYSFWAVEGLIGFRNGYTANSNNFFIYLNPRTEKFHFLPWGVDSAFEKYSSIEFSHPTTLAEKTMGRITSRLYQIESVRQRYAKTLKEIMDQHWDENKLIAQIDRRQAMLKPHLAPSQVRTFQTERIRDFIRTRRTKPAQAQHNVNLFPTDEVLKVEITVEDRDWNAIRHQSRDFFNALKAERKSGPLKGPYTWVTANVKIGGVEFPSVGLRKKGFLGSQNSERPSLKIKLNHLDERAQINGLSMLTFNNNQQDISLMSQAMGYALYNAAGSQASRCGYAHITVNGKNLGIYSHVESVREPLLKREFANDLGTLYEGTVVDFFKGWDAAFENKVGEDAPGREKINQLIRVLEQRNLSDVEQAIGELVDLDSFYRFWAVEGLIGFWDGYTANNNNYFVYLSPKTGKLHFLPWGLDCAYEKYSKLPGNSRRAPLSVKTKGRVAYRLYQVESCRKRYAKTLLQIMGEHWDEEKMIAEIDRRHAMLKPHLASSQTRSFQVKSIQNFIRTRQKELTAEISGGMPIWTAKPDPPFIMPPILNIFKPKNKNGDIWTLTKEGNLAGLKKALSRGVEINGRDFMGSTPLSLAALTGRTEVIDLLIRNGADVNGQNKDGATPLLGAAFLGRVEAVKLLLAEGADPNIRNEKGETPLDVSSGEWDDRMKRLAGLLAIVMKIKIDTATVKTGRLKVVEILRAKGAKPGSGLD